MCAKRRINDSFFDLFSLASSTNCRILEAVELLKVLLTFIFNNPEIFTHPDTTLSPKVTSFGMLSPVKATVLRLELPSIISPSSGIFSPGFTSIVSPMATLAGFVTMISPFFITFAESGRISIRLEIESRVLSSA